MWSNLGLVSFSWVTVNKSGENDITIWSSPMNHRTKQELDMKKKHNKCNVIN